ncbi:MAG: STAS domain-containing protein, partial [Chitinivibrionales bacterium]|nr:STAS domain-containing protein [Chitinivibrionales bacterium]
SNTTYIDSSAITLMLNYQKSVQEKNGNVVVFGASEDAKSIFSIVGLDTSITVFDTRGQFEEAVKM